MLTAALFYLFSAVLLTSAVMVVASRNPVHAVLFLILCFFNAAGLFLLLGAEFVAFILVIVYVGAVAVLFLFVVMMLDVNFAEMREGIQRYAPIGLVVGLILLAELGLVLIGWHFAAGVGASGIRMSPTPITLHKTRALGDVIYTRYVLLFQLAGLVLLVAMIGAIVLTHRDRGTVRRQRIATQTARKPAETLVMMTVALGAGIEETGILRPLESEPPAAHASAAVGHHLPHSAEPH
ncbi:MAG: NADH-quinone oxidoreductase subunit J [Acetobacteraceae bacterium]